MGKLSLYVADTETTSLDIRGDIIEISFLRISDGEQKTWYLKAIHEDQISEEALEINQHKLEDITWKTEAGKQKYRLPEEVLPEIENWLYDDGVTKLDRILVGHNIGFDQVRLEELWKRCNANETYPFGYNTIDTKVIAVFFDWIQGANSRKYALSSVIARLGLTKRKAHSADQDVLMTASMLTYFYNFFSKLIDKSEVALPLLGEEVIDTTPDTERSVNSEENNVDEDVSEESSEGTDSD